MGLIYNSGHGVDVNYKKAIKWYEKAAEQGDADAQYNLGLMYYLSLYSLHLSLQTISHFVSFYCHQPSSLSSFPASSPAPPLLLLK